MRSISHTTPAALPAAVPTADRRAVIHASVETYNRAHSEARLPRAAARLLLTMFPAADEFCAPQQLLREAGYGHRVGQILHALVAAGLLTRQAGTSRSAPDSYRLATPEVRQ